MRRLGQPLQRYIFEVSGIAKLGLVSLLDSPPPDMPSLNSLRAFEVAARLGSFARAAEELRSSPAAVAQHVKKVEAWAEQPLFTRLAHGVRLNDAGASALGHLSEAFLAIGRATVALRAQRPSPKTLRIAALPALAQMWVVPRLAQIRSVLPGVDVSVDATDKLVDLDHDPYDLAVFYGPTGEDVAGPASDELIPVASPSVAAELRSVAQLAQHNLLYDRTWMADWDIWLRSAGAQLEDRTGTSFTLYAMAVEAALKGEGVLVGRRSLVDRFLEDGTLVAPFPHSVKTGDAVQLRFHTPINPAWKGLADVGYTLSQSTQDP